MSIQVEVDLKEILFRIDQKLDNLSKDVSDLKVGQARLEEKVDGLEKRMELELGALNKRMDFQEFVSRGVLIGLIVTILGGFAKVFGIVGNP